MLITAYNNGSMYAKRRDSQDIYDVLMFANQQILDYFYICFVPLGVIQEWS